MTGLLTGVTTTRLRRATEPIQLGAEPTELLLCFLALALLFFLASLSFHARTVCVRQLRLQ